MIFANINKKPNIEQLEVPNKKTSSLKNVLDKKKA
jgi:hypothetical protein